MSQLDKEYFDKAEEAIMATLRAVQPKLMKAFGNVSYDSKSDTTPVTEFDKEVEVLLKDALKKVDSEAGFLGEEFGAEGSKENYWVIDPIDGTESFIRGLPTCRNQLAYISNNEVIYALVYRFPTDDLYTAHKGRGAFKNGKRINISKKPLQKCWLEMSLNLLDPESYDMFKRVRPEIAGMMVTRDYLLSIEGIVDGSICYGHEGGPWDFAPRILLAKEAGARVANVGKETCDFNERNLVYIHPDNFEELQKLLSPQA